MTSKILQSSSVSLSDGLRIIIYHIKRLYSIKIELESKQNIKIMKEYFEYCQYNHCETDKNILKLVNDFIEYYNDLFIDIFRINKKLVNISKCESFDIFMNNFLFCNLSNKYFQYFVFENVDLFPILHELKDSNKCNKICNEYLQFQVVSPSTSNVESMFSVFKHHYHPNSLDLTVESTVNCNFNLTDFGSKKWTYEKRYLLEEVLENIERKRDDQENLD